jgi:hypothetical protein
MIRDVAFVTHHVLCLLRQWVPEVPEVLMTIKFETTGDLER